MRIPKTHFSVVIPFFNEQHYLGRTLQSWADQDRLPETMILVNNACTDQSWEIALKFQEDYRSKMEIILLTELRPGKIFALEKAQQHLKGEWAVFCDADTWYPAHYLSLVERLAQNSRETVVSIMALDLPDIPECRDSRFKIWFKQVASVLFHNKCHTGGFGQCFKISALKKCGGFDSK